MKFNLRILADRLFCKNLQVLVGRWTIDYDKNIQERKVYLTNMDHCGCCGDVNSTQNNVKKNNLSKSSLNFKITSERLPKKGSRNASSKYIK
jgi:hypothetical protein